MVNVLNQYKNSYDDTRIGVFIETKILFLAIL